MNYFLCSTQFETLNYFFPPSMKPEQFLLNPSARPSTGDPWRSKGTWWLTSTTSQGRKCYPPTWRTGYYSPSKKHLFICVRWINTGLRKREKRRLPGILQSFENCKPHIPSLPVSHSFMKGGSRYGSRKEREKNCPGIRLRFKSCKLSLQKNPSNQAVVESNPYIVTA